MSVSEPPPVVLDVGSASIKAGLASERRPSHVIRSVIGYSIEESTDSVDSWIGDEIFEDCSLKKRVINPVQRGKVEDWTAFEKILDYTFGDEQMHLLEPSEHSILSSEAPLAPRKNRERMCEMMMEMYQFRAFFLSVGATLSLYSSARTTGVVCNTGRGVTTSVPIFEGFAVSHAVQRMDLGGRDVNDYLRQMLVGSTAGSPRSSSLSPDLFAGMEGRETLRRMKEELCFVGERGEYGSSSTMVTSSELLSSIATPFSDAVTPVVTTRVIPPMPSAVGSSSLGSCTTPASKMDDRSFFELTSDEDEKVETNGLLLEEDWPLPEMTECSISSNLLSHATPRVHGEVHLNQEGEAHYSLPDGSVLTVGNKIRRCPEVLFDPSLLGLEYDGIHEMVHKSVMKSDIDLRSELFSNIVVCGGNSKFAGFERRLQNEVESLAPPMLKGIKVESAVMDEDNEHAVWIGGSVLSMLSCFEDMWIYQDEYLEHGPSIVHRRCG